MAKEITKPIEQEESRKKRLSENSKRWYQKHREEIRKRIKKRYKTDKKYRERRRELDKKRGRRRYFTEKTKAIKLLGGKCQICGYNKSLAALHFHHIDKKKEKIGRLFWGAKKEKVMSELKKCILVCANCHAEIHSKNFQEYERK